MLSIAKTPENTNIRQGTNIIADGNVTFEVISSNAPDVPQVLFNEAVEDTVGSTGSAIFNEG